MPHVVDALRQLLRGSAAPTSGTVESVSGAQARVRTRNGIINLSSNGLNVQPGQRVTLGPSGIIGISAPPDQLPVFDL